MDMRSEPIEEYTRAEFAAALERDDPATLSQAVLSAALHDPDPAWAAAATLRLAAHPHPNVRGNAILALGHIARRHRWLPYEETRDALVRGLQDVDAYVRGHADSATDDVEQVLGWELRPMTSNG